MFFFFALMNFQKIYSKAQKRRTPVPPQRELSDSEDDNGLYKWEAEKKKQEDFFILLFYIYISRWSSGWGQWERHRCRWRQQLQREPELWRQTESSLVALPGSQQWSVLAFHAKTSYRTYFSFFFHNFYTTKSYILTDH